MLDPIRELLIDEFEKRPITITLVALAVVGVGFYF